MAEETPETLIAVHVAREYARRTGRDPDEFQRAQEQANRDRCASN